MSSDNSIVVFSSILSKAASKGGEVMQWKPRRCTLSHTRFSYSKDEKRQRDISLNDIIQVLLCPHDTSTFLMQTRLRSYYWKATNQGLADKWIAYINAKCNENRETLMLVNIEDKIRSAQLQKSNTTAQLLDSLSTIEGCLEIKDSRDLLVYFVTDYFSSEACQTRQDSCPYTLKEICFYIEHYPNQDDGMDIEHNGIRKWLCEEIAPHFFKSAMIQRRISQIAAFHDLCSPPLSN